jgi:Domain of unknown function (DUF4404)
MATKHLSDLLPEIEAALRGDAISDHDRALLERLRGDLQANSSQNPGVQPAPALRSSLGQAIKHFEVKHPQLTGALSRALDALSDLGV